MSKLAYHISNLPPEIAHGIPTSTKYFGSSSVDPVFISSDKLMYLLLSMVLSSPSKVTCHICNDKKVRS